MDCYRCNLALHRTNVVTGVGSYPNKVAIIMDFPSYSDDKSGIILNSKFGEKFKNLLYEYNLHNSYITYAVKCRAKYSNITIKEVERCYKSILINELNIVKPSIILTFGSISNNLFIKTSISDINTSMYKIGNVHIFPFYSLSYIKSKKLDILLVNRIEWIYNKILQI